MVNANLYRRIAAALKLFFAGIALLCFVTGAPAMAAGKKIALIIGNSNYVNGLRLPNPQNDARLVAQTAIKAGFEVTQISDVAVTGFHQALKDFRSKADTSEVAMVYYAGHGIDNNGENWLIPTDALLSDPRDLSQEAIRLSEVLDTVAGAKLRVILLDACRNSPFADKWTSLSRAIQPGLSRVDAAEGSLVIFAADAGSTILDEGADGNSYFAKAISDRLAEPGLSLQLLGNKIYGDVLKQSGGKQRPTTAQRLPGMEYYLVAKPEDPSSGLTTDQADWLRAKDMNTAEAYRLYMRMHPQGKYFAVAQSYYEDKMLTSGVRPQQNPTASPDVASAPQQANVVQPAASPAPAYSNTAVASQTPPPSQTTPAYVPAPEVTATKQPVYGPTVLTPAPQAQPSSAPMVLPPASAAPPITQSPVVVATLTQAQSATYVAPPIARQYGTGGFPVMPEPPRFGFGQYPACKDNWQSVVDPLSKAKATNDCKDVFSAYKSNWLNKYREAMNNYIEVIGGIYTNEVAPPHFPTRESEVQQFYAEMRRRTSGVLDGGYLMAEYEQGLAKYNADFAAVVDSYDVATGCHGHPTPAGLAPNPNCSK